MNASADGPNDEPILGTPAVPTTSAGNSASDGAATTSPGDGPTPSTLRQSSGSWQLISGRWPYVGRRPVPMPVPGPGAGTPAADISAVDPTHPDPTHADPPDPAPSRVISPPAHPRRSRMPSLLGALAALILLSGSALVLSRLVTQPDTARSETGAWATRQIAEPMPAKPTSVKPAPAVSSTAPSSGRVSVVPTATPTASASTTARTKASTSSAPALPFEAGAFELTGSVPELDVTVGALGTEPVRVSAPNGAEPQVEVDGNNVRLAATANVGNRLTVQLNERIAWAVRISAEVQSADFELARATLSRLDLTGGATLLEMALPAGKQAIPIRMSGGVKTWRITTARRVPLRVVLRQGGGEVVLNGRRVRGVARNTTLDDRVAGSGAAGLNIEAVTGLDTLTIGPVGERKRNTPAPSSGVVRAGRGPGQDHAARHPRPPARLPHPPPADTCSPLPTGSCAATTPAPGSGWNHSSTSQRPVGG